MTHICVSKLTIIGSDNGLSPGWRQAIIWTNAGILLIRTWGINFNEVSSEIRTFSFKKMHLKWRLWNGVHFVSASMCQYMVNCYAITYELYKMIQRFYWETFQFLNRLFLAMVSWGCSSQWNYSFYSRITLCYVKIYTIRAVRVGSTRLKSLWNFAYTSLCLLWLLLVVLQRDSSVSSHLVNVYHTAWFIIDKQ